MKNLNLPDTVLLRNGYERKGLLLKRHATGMDLYWEFVPERHLRSYVRSKDRRLIEKVPLSEIRSVIFGDAYST